MSRRRIVRPVPDSAPTSVVDPRRIAKLRDRLEIARQALARWLSRMKRACRAVEKHQAQISRIEKQIRRLE